MSLLDDLLAIRNAASGQDWASMTHEERRAALRSEQEPSEPTDGKCPSRKASHLTKDAALYEIKHAKMTPGAEPYMCKKCHGWHVGNPPPKKRRIKVRR
jgi:hypothetical protein